MKYDIVTIGDAFEDVFVEPQLNSKFSRNSITGRTISFELGEKIPLDSAIYEIGGSACNAAVGLSRLGYDTSLITLMGEDTPKDRVVERLRKERVDTDQLIINNKFQTGFSIVFRVDCNRTIFVYHGVKDYAEYRIKKNFKTNWFFVTPLGKNIDEIEKRMIEEVSQKNVKLAWNPGACQINAGAVASSAMLQVTSILFLNKEEGVKFVNMAVKPSMEQLLRKLHSFGPKIVVVTDGVNGAYAFNGEKIYFREADKRIKPIDVTGAGDSFATGVLGKLIGLNWDEKIDGRDIEDALKWGHKNSSSVIRHIGAQPGLLNSEQINDLV